MAHIVVPEAEALLDLELKVLDKGFVRLVDYMGGDARVVQSARVSYGAGTKTVREDQGLINYLMKNEHTSPFEQVSLVFHIKLPLFIFAQMVRHRTAKLNSMSARYSVMENEFYLPTLDNIRQQSDKNKQVGEGQFDEEGAQLIHKIFSQIAEDDYGVYEDLLAHGVAREQSRMVLGQNLYTQIYWKCDLHNLLHFLGLRLDWHAQYEIRVYAEAMAKCAQAVAPMSYESFEEYHPKRGAALFSRTELQYIAQLFKDRPLPGVVEHFGGNMKAVHEFEDKLRKGLV